MSTLPNSDVTHTKKPKKNISYDRKAVTWTLQTREGRSFSFQVQIFLPCLLAAGRMAVVDVAKLSTPFITVHTITKIIMLTIIIKINANNSRTSNPFPGRQRPSLAFAHSN